MKEIRILWTDDEIDFLKPLILFLEGKGYTVLTASSGDEAVKMVEKQSFDLLFLDENMPGMSGLGLQEKRDKNLIFVPQERVQVSDIVSFLVGRGMKIEGVRKRQASLEEIYAAILREVEP